VHTKDNCNEHLIYDFSAAYLATLTELHLRLLPQNLRILNLIPVVRHFLFVVVSI